MKIFREIDGNQSKVKKYNDDVVKLRIRCGEGEEKGKTAGEYPKGDLAKVLNALNLTAQETTYWNLKEKIWNILNIAVPPEKISDSKKTIYERELSNAADVEILRDKEGTLILEALNLPLQTAKKECERVLIEKIINSSNTIQNDEYEDISQHKSEFSSLDKTERESIIKSRLGQGIFRDKLIANWGCCSVTKMGNHSILMASHIKPWRDCTNEERLDPNNGLLLIPNLDTPFDKGLITFNDDGVIIISEKIQSADIKLLGIAAEMRLTKTTQEMKQYLKYHRELFHENYFKGSL